MMKKILIFSLAAIILSVTIFALSGKIAPLSWQLWGEINQQSGVGLRGYDVVSYHTQEEPRLGNDEISSHWKGADWHFISVKNKAIFDSDPERYAPSYGGFCAFAVLKQFTADVDPTVWYIKNGKLYLFASDRPKNDWVAEISSGAIEKSNQNWAQSVR